MRGPARRRRFAPAALAAAVALAACAGEQAPAGDDAGTAGVTALAAVDRSTVTVGDPIRYTVELRHPEQVAPHLLGPVADGAIGGLQVADAGVERARRSRGVVVERHWWLLRADGTGSFVLPPAVVTYDAGGGEQRLESNEVFVDVASVLPDDAEDIRDVKPPRRSTSWTRWLWAAAGALAVMGALLAWWWWRRRRDRTAAAQPALLPHEIALRDLDRLRRTDFTSLAELRRYYFEISEVLRRYVEARFGLNATDLTTEEILAKLSELRGLAGAESVSLREFLLATDRVKYAAAVPTGGEIEQTYELALSFVESTRPREDDVATPSSAAGSPPAGADRSQGTAASAPPPEAPRRRVAG